MGGGVRASGRRGGVREIKEAIAVVRLELAKHQPDIVDSMLGWDGVCRYVVAMLWFLLCFVAKF